VVSAVQAEHDSVGHLLESRCAAATGEVFEALRERACRSIEDADVIEREDLASFSAPLDSFLRVAVHEPSIAGWKVSGNSTEPCSQLPGSQLPEQVSGGKRPCRQPNGRCSDRVAPSRQNIAQMIHAIPLSCPESNIELLEHPLREQCL
jgi:hypothetical protein